MAVDMNRSFESHPALAYQSERAYACPEGGGGGASLPTDRPSRVLWWRVWSRARIVLAEMVSSEGAKTEKKYAILWWGVSTYEGE